MKNKKLKIIIAPDSFKGSISAQGAAEAIERGLQSGADARGIKLTTVKLPIADGGEGTLDALTYGNDSISMTVTSTNGNRIEAQYGVIGDVAVIEMARAAGLTLTPEESRNAATATTFGVGELILDALGKGYRHILLTVGGSGTNDGGCGMFACLGARFTDKNGKTFIPTGGTLDEICDIDTSKLDRRLFDCRFTIATDVKNSLCGKMGATFVYGKQKGADDATLLKMENGMKKYASLISQKCGRDISVIEGCGAGGGLSAPLLAFLNAEIRSGIDSVLDAIGFDGQIKDADAIITGEGKIDVQSLYGKAISGVCKRAKEHNIPVYCLVGCIGGNRQELLGMGIADIYATADIAPSSEYSMAHADELLRILARDYIENIK